MPYLEFQCRQGHITERFFRSISEGEKTDWIYCEQCWNDPAVPQYFEFIQAKKIMSRPLGFGLYGDPAGYDKPSATKRHSTKTVSAKTGNDSAVG